jgi:hypothetical protein
MDEFARLAFDKSPVTPPLPDEARFIAAKYEPGTVPELMIDPGSGGTSDRVSSPPLVVSTIVLFPVAPTGSPALCAAPVVPLHCGIYPLVVVPGPVMPPPAETVAQFAVVELVAVRTCPFVGAVALFTETIVVAEFRPLAVVAVLAVPVKFAEIVPAEKFPDPSRETIVDAVLAFVASLLIVTPAEPL